MDGTGCSNRHRAAYQYLERSLRIMPMYIQGPTFGWRIRPLFPARKEHAAALVKPQRLCNPTGILPTDGNIQESRTTSGAWAMVKSVVQPKGLQVAAG